MKKTALAIFAAMFIVFFAGAALAADEKKPAKKMGGIVELKMETIKSKAWRPEPMEAFSWKKERLKSDKLTKKESFIPRIKKSVNKDPF